MAKGKFLVAESFEFLVVMWRVSKLVQGQNNLYLLYLYNYKLLYKFNQTVQINKNPQPDRPEGQIIKKSRACAILVPRPEDSNHKRFLSHSSHFRGSEFFASIVF